MGWRSNVQSSQNSSQYIKWNLSTGCCHWCFTVINLLHPKMSQFERTQSSSLDPTWYQIVSVFRTTVKISAFTNSGVPFRTNSMFNCCRGMVDQNFLQRHAECVLLACTSLGRIRTPWSICFLCGLSSTVAVAEFDLETNTLSSDLEKIQLIGILSIDWVMCVLLLIVVYVYMYVLVTQSYLTLCNPMDCSLLGSSFHGILQASILEW